MHELPLCEAVCDQVLAGSAGRPVRRIAVEVGAMHHATPAAFQQLFSQAAAGTRAAGAVVDMTVVPATYRCACGSEGFVADARLPLCAACDSPVRPVDGDRLQVVAVDYDEER